MQRIVIVQGGDQIAAGASYQIKPIALWTEITWVAMVDNSWVIVRAHNRFGLIAAAIIADHQLEVGKALRQSRIDRAAQVVGALIGRQQNGYRCHFSSLQSKLYGHSPGYTRFDP